MLGMPRAWVEIDLDALSHNVQLLNSILSEETNIMGVVKADGYGHGAVEISRHLLAEGVTALAVSVLDEGVELRRAGLGVPILILSYVPVDRCDMVVRYGLMPTVFTFDVAKALSDAAFRQNKRIGVHVNVDTGMNRLGLSADRAVDFILSIAQLPHISVEGIYSHYATADEVDNEYAMIQHHAFARVCKQLEKSGVINVQKHIANSAAALMTSYTAYNMARIGIALYGLYPSQYVKQKSSISLRQVLSLKTVVSYVKKVPPGTPISYGRTFVTERPSVIATLPIGYADGYSRRLSHRAEVLIHGQRVPVVGNICMDQCMVDVTDVADVKVADEVVLIGTQEQDNISIDYIASMLGTINYEIPCMINKRVPRIYIKDGKVQTTKVYLNCT